MRTIRRKSKKLLTNGEKEYLEAVIRPYADKVIFIKKINDVMCNKITIKIENNTNKVCGESISPDHYMSFLLLFESYYKGMEFDKEYTPDELGLFKE